MSGQRDKLQGAVNDPWRRPAVSLETRTKLLYVAHVEHALRGGVKISQSVRSDYERATQELAREDAPLEPAGQVQVDVPTPADSTPGDIF